MDTLRASDRRNGVAHMLKVDLLFAPGRILYFYFEEGCRDRERFPFRDTSAVSG